MINYWNNNTVNYIIILNSKYLMIYTIMTNIKITIPILVVKQMSINY